MMSGTHRASRTDGTRFETVQLHLVNEMNEMLTYMNANVTLVLTKTGQKFAFIRGHHPAAPIFLPSLSKILYPSSGNRAQYQQYP